MKRALLVIDVQNVYFGDRMRVTHPADSLDNILAAMDAAARHGVPIVVIQHTSPKGGSFGRGVPAWELHPDVAARHYDKLIEKNRPGSFTGTDLEAWLRDNGIDTVTIAGYMTQMCCDTTARQASHLGFAVEFLSDATGTLAFTNAGGSATAEELHRATLVAQAYAFSKVMTTAAWIGALTPERPVPPESSPAA
ncbi:MAG: cysteine hydrolase family protein [Chloroflexota bacterium]